GRMRVRDAAAAIEAGLTTRLQVPPASDLTPIAQLDDRLARADRVKLPGEARDIGIEAARSAADPGIADGDSGLVLGAAERPFIGQSAVSVEIDQVAVAGRDAGPGEYAQARVFGVVDQQWL